MQAAAVQSSPLTGAFIWAGYLIGFALGGFWDGIILHQILQWHHLLAGLQGEPFSDIRFQILADGLFHALMYVVAAIGLWMLFRHRERFAGRGAGTALFSALLIGFGVWHIVDTVFSHWLTGIHRIRMDVPNPLVWDIGWLILFGLVPLFAGLALRRRARREERTGSGRAHLVAMIAAVTVAAGAIAGMPPNVTGQPSTVTVVLRPDVRAGEFLSALSGDSRIIWNDRAGGVWVLAAEGVPSAFDLYKGGALYVSGSVLPAGCSAWLRTSL